VVEAASGFSLERAYAHCETLLHDHDKDRYLADLFIPATRRAHVHALHAFSFEIARIRELVSEPMPGELRHQWWRDVLANDARSAPSANPVAAALIDTMDRLSLPRAPLIALIDARGFDLYDDPMPDMSTLETYCRETSSLQFRWVGEILGGGGPQAASPAAQEAHRNCPDASAVSPVLLAAADHAGLAYAFTGLIRAFALHAARGQLYIPSDLLHQHGSSPEEALNGRATPALLASIGEWRAKARRHLAEAQASVRKLGKAIVPAFLPLVLVDPYLRRTEERSYDPFRSPIEIPQWRRQWRLWRGLPTPPRSKS
jgi:15-cis-phytoene synthase